MEEKQDHSMYFIAVVCPPEVDSKVTEYKQWVKERFGCVSAMKSPAHVTLMKPFWMERSWEDDLQRALQSVDTDSIAPVIETDDFSNFGKRVLYVDIRQNPTLNDLRSRVEKRFRQSFGDTLKIDQLPFHPHITIASRDIKPGDFDKAWEHFSGKQFRDQFPVKAISLLKLVEGKWEVIGEKKLQVE